MAGTNSGELRLEPLAYYKWHWRDYRANRRVQRMCWQARGLYRELLDEFWAEGVIPADTKELANICGCDHTSFLMYWPEIESCWQETEHGFVNRKMEAQRTEIDTQRVLRARAGAKGGKVSNSHTRSKQVQANAKQMQASPDIEEKRREEKSKEKKSSSADADKRTQSFIASCKTYAEHHRVEFLWDGSEGKQLQLLLRAAPGLTVEEFRRCLNHRSRSDGITHGDRPRVYLPTITKYQQGPLDTFGHLKGVSNGFKGKTDSSLDAAEAAIRTVRARKDGANYPLSGETGSPPSGEAGARGLLGAG